MKKRSPTISAADRKAGMRKMRFHDRFARLDEYYPPVYFLAFCEGCDEIDRCQLFTTDTTVSGDAYALFLCEECEEAVRPVRT